MYPAAKVYHDGSHYVAIPYKAPKRKHKKIKEKSLLDIIEEKEFKDAKEKREEIIKEAYESSEGKNKNEKIANAVEKLKAQCINESMARETIERQLENKKRALAVRRKRFVRKAFLNEFNYFVTFTYDDTKHTPESFKKLLIHRLSLLRKKYDWKYMGVWEKSPEKERVHFHGLLYIPKGTMVGEIVERKDYSLKTHNMQITHVNTYFEEKFGRNDFEEIDYDFLRVTNAIAYILKYISKSENNIIYSRNIPMYLISDINEEDELCRMGNYLNKIVLPDDFECWDEGEYLGNMDGDVKAQLRTTNA